MSQCQLLISMGITSADIKSSVDSYIGSKQYIKEIVPLSICNIVYNRLEDHEEYFESREIETLKFKIFKPKMKNNKFVNIYKGSKGAMHALDNNYLKELFFFLKDEKTGEILENYSFMFRYTNPEEIAEKPKSKDVIAKTDLLLKSIESLRDYKKFLAKNIQFNIELTYYENVTPKEYEPPYYEAENTKPNFESLSQTSNTNYVYLGCIRTGHHVLKCRGRGKVFQTSPLSIHSKTTGIECADKDKNDKILSKSDSMLSLSDDLNVDDINDSLIQTSDQCEICCPCEIICSFEKTGTIGTILCVSCYRIQHSACMGFQNFAKAPHDYICHICGDLKGKDATDVILKNTPMKHRKRLAALRLALVYLINTKEIPNLVIEKFPPEIQQTIWTDLQKIKIVVNSKTGKKLNLKAIHECEKYFYDFQTTEKKNIDKEDSMLLPKDIPNKRNYDQTIPSIFNIPALVTTSTQSTLTQESNYSLDDERLIKKLKKSNCL